MKTPKTILETILDSPTIEPDPRLLSSLSVPHFKNDAEWTYERLAEYILDFQNELDNTQEVGAFIANFPNGVVHFTNVGYWGPDIITFEGLTSDKKKVKLIQNIAQLNVTLIAVPILGDEPNREDE